MVPGGGSGRCARGLRGLAGSDQSSSSAASYRTGAVISPEPPWRSLFSVDMLPNATLARRPIGTATAPTPRPVCDNIDRNDPPVNSSAPPTPAATKTTIAPPEASRLRNGSPTSAPIQPPARPNVSKWAMIFSGPRTMCSSPSSDNPSNPHPIASRNGCVLRPLRTRATPTAIRAMGTMNRPIPVNQPTTVSTPRPSGPARSR